MILFADMELVSLRPRRAPTEHHSIKPRKSLPKMVPASANTGNNTSKRRDPAASFGQRRKSVESNSATFKRRSEGGDIIRHGDDGGMVISYMPSSSKGRSDRSDDNDRKNGHKKKKSGIEYLGAGLERGVERTELPESERQGRTHRRQGIRSGSKNAFRGL